jgi:hypothetical protein
MATRGKWEGPENGSNKRNSFAVGCDQLPKEFHGKEGVAFAPNASGWRDCDHRFKHAADPTPALPGG